MNKAEYAQYHRDVCEKMIEITRQKNSDYCGAGSDPFKNFRQVELMGICSVEQGFLTRMTDKMSRIASYVEQGTLEVKDESVTDTLCDLSNYCILMMGYLQSKKKETPPPIPTQNPLDSITAADLRMIKLSQMPKAPTTLGQKKSFRE